MKRRKFLASGLALSAGAWLPHSFASGSVTAKLSMVLTNGKAFVGGKWQTLRIGITPAGQMTLLTEIPADVIGFDGGIERAPRANYHPRGAGCFATAIRHGLDIGLPLEKNLDKMTTLPRKILQPVLKNSGVIGEGMQADLVVFDPVKIKGLASVENPNQFSAGIRLVVVNGKVAVQNGVLGKSAGVPIRY